ncbi:MAG: hypothetical protein WAK95_01735 [Desulfobacterales bacterium]
MKLAKLTVVFILMVALLGFGGCSDQGTTGGQGQKPAAKGTGMPSADDTPMDKEEISGVLEQGEAGIVLVSGSEKYLVTGQDLTAMIGKRVTITGVVEESGGHKKVEVEKVTEAE